MKTHTGPASERFAAVMTTQLFGVEIDPELYSRALGSLEEAFGSLPERHNLIRGDFFSTEYMAKSFDFVVGNPPFGGTFDPALEDALDKRYGRWKSHKLKKETYSFFIARSLDLLSPTGCLTFICSDTFLTINTMKGLRARLMDQASVTISTMPEFSDETSHPVLLLQARLSNNASSVFVDGTELLPALVASTENLSWRVTDDLAHYFGSRVMGDVIVCTGGMTVGRNELFVRTISEESIEEPYEFEFFQEPITVARELERARLNRISPKKLASIRQQELAGETRRNVRVISRPNGPVKIDLPHPDYRLYNKGDGGVVYSKPKAAIYWADDGDAVLTFKKNGNWYLHGVGGRGYFEREGLTWQLVSARINMRYLPPGYILDSGAPCAFLRPGVSREELWIALGWTMTERATEILKTVLNHTRNIQSKDIERLPYPHWLSPNARIGVATLVENMVQAAMRGREFNRADREFEDLETLFAFPPP